MLVGEDDPVAGGEILGDGGESPAVDLAGEVPTSWPGRLVGSSLAWSLLLAILAWPVPPLALNPCPGLDCSWQSSLQRSAVLGMPYGTHVIFTYGPLGFLTVPQLFEEVPAVLAFGFILGVSVGAFFVVLRGLRSALPLWAAVPTAYLAGSVAIIASTSIDAYYYIILPVRPQLLLVFCLAIGVALIVLDVSDRANPHRGLWAAGLGALGATTTLVLPGLAGGVIVVVVAVVAVAPQTVRWLTFRSMLIGGAVAGFIGWFATGNGMSNIVPFIGNTVSIVSGYGEAMGLFNVPDRLQALTLVDVLVIGALVVLAGRGRSRIAWAGLATMTVVVVWILCKESYVRPDAAHQYVFLAAAPLVVAALMGAASRRWLGVSALVVTTGVTVFAVGSFPAFKGYGPLTVAHNFASEVNSLVVTSRRAAITNGQRNWMAVELAVPPAMVARMRGHCVDVDLNDQVVTLAYRGIGYCPLPVPQGYAAYTSRLDRADTQDLTGASGPQQILRQVGSGSPTILPPPGAWSPPLAELTMECRYIQVAVSTGWQLTSRVSDRCGHPVLVRTVVGRQGQWVQVPPAVPGTAVLATFSVSYPTIWSIDSLLLRSPALYATVVLHGDVPDYYQFVPALEQDLHVIRPASTLGYAAAFAPPDIDSITVSAGGVHPRPGRMVIDFYRMTMR